MILSNKTYYTGQEGAARSSTKEYIRFLDIASGSLAELDTQFVIGYELKYITKEVSQNIEFEMERISKMLHGLMKYLRGLDS